MLDGYITYDLVHGSYNAELFNNFIQNQVLPLCNPYPGPRSILVMDNARIHKSEVGTTSNTCISHRKTNFKDLRNMCREAQVELKFLPPYSPDLNPIEESFAEL